MGFSLGGAVNRAAEWACSSPLVGGVVTNGLLAALLVTTLIALALLGLYREEVREGGRKRAVRAVLYILLITSGVMFVHHFAAARAFSAKADRDGIRGTFEGIEAAQALGGGPDRVPVVPDLSSEYRRGDMSELGGGAEEDAYAYPRAHEPRRPRPPEPRFAGGERHSLHAHAHPHGYAHAHPAASGGGAFGGGAFGGGASGEIESYDAFEPRYAGPSEPGFAPGRGAAPERGAAPPRERGGWGPRGDNVAPPPRDPRGV